MKTVLVITLLVGLTAAASPQQRSPVYQPREVSAPSNLGGGGGGGGGGQNGGLSATLQQNVNSFISRSSPALPPSTTPVSTTGYPLPVVAEARESVVTSDASMLQPQSSVNTGTPSQVCNEYEMK